MNTLSKTLLAIISGLVIAITGILLYVYWPAITGTINDSQYLTPEQGQEMYDKGYEDGNRSQEEQLAQIAYYKELTDEYYIQVNLLNNEISVLNGQIVEKNQTISELNNIKNANLQTIADLNEVVSSNQEMIRNLNNEVSDLESDKSSLETQILSLNENIANKAVIITGLNAQVSELQADLNVKRNQNVNLNNQINNLQAQIVSLQNDSSSNATVIEGLRSQIVTLTNEKNNLEGEIANKETQIVNLNVQISTLNNEIADLQSQVTSKENTISYLNSQIVNLQNLNIQLARTNQSNVDTIATLNNQIVNLNSQITNLTLQIQNSSLNATALNNRISELENSISYYENFIAGLQSDSQVVATFIYDGSVYNIQVLNSGACASVSTPESTTYKVFNGWKVNDMFVDLANYPLTENTTFVANITYKYDVTYIVDNEVVSSQLVVKDTYSTVPTNPSKTNYQFDGWAVDDLIVSPSSYAITENTIFRAKFTRLYNVTFVYESTTKSTQIVRNGECASDVSIEDTAYKVFNGWKVDGVIVNVSEYHITADTQFVADITYKYDVVFKVDNTNYNSQIVTKNGYPTLPANPVKTGYDFDGWTLDGTNVVSPTTISVVNNTTYIAKFTKVHTVTFRYENDIVSTQRVRNNEYAQNVNANNTTYKVFNGWSLNGSIVNISNTRITADTQFIADITYRYDVYFKVENTTYNIQIVDLNNYASVPTNPTKTGYTFDGWTLNGQIVDVSETAITENTIFTAQFTINSYAVTFMYDDSVIETQYVTHGSFANASAIDYSLYRGFNGWKINDVFVDVSTWQILQDTTFTADILIPYSVTFMVDGEAYTNQTVYDGNYIVIPADPVKTNYIFEGWSIDGTNVEDLTEMLIDEDTTFVAIFRYDFDGTYSGRDGSVTTLQVTVQDGKVVSGKYNGTTFTVIDLGNGSYRTSTGIKQSSGSYTYIHFTFTISPSLEGKIRVNYKRNTSSNFNSSGASTSSSFYINKA